MVMPDLDEIDIRILDALQQDGRISIVSLAERVGLSTTPCARRVQQLQDDGVIDRYVAVLDPQSLGLNLDVFVEVCLVNKSSSTVTKFEKALKAMPEIVEAYFLTGDSDYLLRVRVEDTDHFRDFLREQLLKIPDVGRTVSSIALQKIKHTTALTLPHPTSTKGRAK